MELFDCDGEELIKETQEPKEEINEYNTDDEDIEFAIEEAASRETIDIEIAKKVLHGLVD